MAKLFIFSFLFFASFSAVFSIPTTTAVPPPLSESEEAALVPAKNKCTLRPPNNETGILPDVPKLGSSYSKMGSCNGGEGWYGTRINKEKGVHSKNPGEAAACFRNARRDIIRTKWGCYRGKSGSCNCVMDSCFIFNYDEVFENAMVALARDTKGYYNNEAERYEGNMYIHYSCNRNNEDIDDELGLYKGEKV